MRCRDVNTELKIMLHEIIIMLHLQCHSFIHALMVCTWSMQFSSLSLLLCRPRAVPVTHPLGQGQH